MNNDTIITIIHIIIIIFLFEHVDKTGSVQCSRFVNLKNRVIVPRRRPQQAAHGQVAFIIPRPRRVN